MERKRTIGLLVWVGVVLALASGAAMSAEDPHARWDISGVYRVATQYGSWLCTNIPLNNQLDHYYNYCELVSTSPPQTTKWHGEFFRTGANTFHMVQMAYTLDGAWLFVTSGPWWRDTDGVIHAEFYWATYGSWQDPYTELPLDCTGPISGTPGTGFQLDMIPECTPD